MTIEGRVIKGTFGKGSKSEHEAVYIDTGDHKYKLKRKGGNPFYDDILHALVGKKIVAEGNLNDYFFEVVTYEEVE